MRDNFVGRQFGNYCLRDHLGSGSFADVYLGEQVYLNTLAAIKILRLHLLDEARAAFLHEAQTIARLEHPHIIRVLEFGIEKERPFLVMNYAPHGTLRQHFRWGIALPPADIVPYLTQIASALDYAHRQKVIHRDVKPENILLKAEGEIILSDFGLATVAPSSLQVTSPDRAGTLMYMAPEQTQGTFSAASDQYALGVMVYEWLTGRLPFVGTPNEIIAQQLSASPPLMKGDLSSGIEAVVRRALMKDASERFPCLGDFAWAFEQESRRLPHAFATTSPVEMVQAIEEPLLQTTHSALNDLLLPVSSTEKTVQRFSAPTPQEHNHRSHLALLPTIPIAVVAPSPRAESVSQPRPAAEKRVRSTRRNVLLGVTGVIAAGTAGAGLATIFLRPQLPSIRVSHQQTPGASASPRLGAPSTSTQATASSSPVNGAPPAAAATPSSPSTPGSSATSRPSATSTAGSDVPFSIQITHYPAMLFNGQVATIEVMASAPGARVTLQVHYNLPPSKALIVSQDADSSGYTSLSWTVKVPPGKKGANPQATLRVSASDASGQNASALPLNVPVTR